MALITGGDLKGHFIITAYLCWITAAQGAGRVWMGAGARCVERDMCHLYCKRAAVGIQGELLSLTLKILGPKLTFGTLTCTKYAEF